MMAMLFATRIIKGKTLFEDVPILLKQPVADVLIGDFERPDIVPVEYGGTLGAEPPVEEPTV